MFFIFRLEEALHPGRVGCCGKKRAAQCQFVSVSADETPL